jgi:hypothetical protein
MTWLDPEIVPPDRIDVGPDHHLRPLREADVDMDYPAVMGSRQRLWQKYGEAWGWPPETLSYEDDREDLARHQAEIRNREAFVYALLDHDETRLLGCVYIDPPEPSSPEGADAMVSWWVVDGAVGTALERSLDQLVPAWLTEVWRFESVHYHP